MAWIELEFFEHASDGERPVLLFHGGGPDEVALLRQVFRSLAEHMDHSVALHELPFIRPIDACTLIARSSRDE
jgi:hypothetical protein